MKRITTILIGAIFFLGLIACSFTPTLDFGQNRVSDPTLPTLVPNSSGPSVVISAEDITSTDTILSSLYERVNPGVVSIVTTSSAGESSGSGFVYDLEGHIITNYHVVEGASAVEVDFPSGYKVRGEVIATDLDSDIAVIKVNAPAEELVPLPLGDSDQIRIGQMVVAIGNPFRLTSTMTLGIISAKGRILDSIRTATDQTPFSAGDIIQTDAAINPGNSGGPLLNLAGEVIGVNRAIRTTGTTLEGEPVNSGIGFAISINIVKQVLPYLIRDGKYDYPFMGISSFSRDLTLTEWQAVSSDQTWGAYLTSVTVDGPADQAGLVAGNRQTNVPNLLAGGDIVIGVDGREVKNYGDLISYIFINKLPGDQIVLRIIRNGTEQEVELTLGTRP